MLLRGINLITVIKWGHDDEYLVQLQFKKNEVTLIKLVEEIEDSWNYVSKFQKLWKFT